MEEKVNSNKKTARLAGLLYLILIITAGFHHQVVWGDTVATANNILASEFLLRISIFSHFISQIVSLILVLVLYRMFKEVNEYRAKLMVAFVLVQIPIVFVLEIFKISSFMMLNGKILKTLEPAQLQDFAMLFIKIHGYGLTILETFWGLWLIPLAQLIYKSGFIPRIFGVLLIISGVAYLIDSCTFLLFPNYRGLVAGVALGIAGIPEIAIMLWLLIRGVKVKKNTI